MLCGYSELGRTNLGAVCWVTDNVVGTSTRTHPFFFFFFLFIFLCFFFLHFLGPLDIIIIIRNIKYQQSRQCAGWVQRGRTNQGGWKQCAAWVQRGRTNQGGWRQHAVWVQRGRTNQGGRRQRAGWVQRGRTNPGTVCWVTDNVVGTSTRTHPFYFLFLFVYFFVFFFLFFFLHFLGPLDIIIIIRNIKYQQSRQCAGWVQRGRINQGGWRQCAAWVQRGRTNPGGTGGSMLGGYSEGGPTRGQCAG